MNPQERGSRALEFALVPFVNGQSTDQTVSARPAPRSKARAHAWVGNWALNRLRLRIVLRHIRLRHGLKVV
jgi:hypothetical protein